MKRNDRLKRASRPRLSYQADPIRNSLKVLGRKWTLLILRDIAFLKLERFGEIRRNNPGLTPRVLSRRLRQMGEEGLLKRKESGKAVFYHLTNRGEDAVYVLLGLLRYGIRHHMGPKGRLDQEEVLKEFSYEPSIDAMKSSSRSSHQPDDLLDDRLTYLRRLRQFPQPKTQG